MPKPMKKSKVPVKKTKNDSKIIEKLFTASNVPNRQISNPPPKQKMAPLKLTKCALKYALAVAEPFNPKARGVCGVMGNSYGPTQKVSATQRFTFVVGSGGIGFAAIVPTLANDGVTAFCSNGSYAGGNINILTANNTLSTGVNTVSNSQIPYTTAQLNPSATSSDNAKLSGRVLSMGVRVTYVGTTMNQSGTYNCLAPSDHSNVSVIPGGTTPMDVPNIQSDPQVVLEPCDRGWCDMNISPTYPYEMGFSSSSSVAGASATLYPFSNGSTYINTFTYAAASVNVGAPIAVIAVSGALGGNVFQVELITHNEYAGPACAGAVTPSESDEQGGRLVLRAASQLSITKASSGKTGWPLMYQLLCEAGSAAIEHLVPMAVNTLVAMV
jgi:hypothetical protein